MRTALYERQPNERIHVFDASTMPWEETARPGLRLKTIRVDDAKGEFLGQIGFDPYVRSGLHQHQGVATSFILEGGLTDYHGAVTLHQVGINYRGSTHDAMSYAPTVLVSKLEGPVTYPQDDKLLSGIHAGSTYRDFRNEDPDVPPEVNVDVDRVTCVPAGVSGLSRQPVYDYGGSGLDRRLLQWRLRPGTALPAWQASDWVELWVRGGELAIDDRKVSANCFVVIEPGATVRMASPFGAIVLVWAEGRERPAPGAPACSLFGY